MDDGRRNASEKLCGRCGAELRAPLLFCSWERTVSGESAEGLGPGSTGLGNSASGTDALRSGYQRDESPASAAKQPTEPVIGSTTTGRFVIGSGGLTLALGLPSVGPTCTRWLKLVGGEMNLERTKGSFNISLQAEGV